MLGVSGGPETELLCVHVLQRTLVLEDFTHLIFLQAGSRWRCSNAQQKVGDHDFFFTVSDHSIQSPVLHKSCLWEGKVPNQT